MAGSPPTGMSSVVNGSNTPRAVGEVRTARPAGVRHAREVCSISNG